MDDDLSLDGTIVSDKKIQKTSIWSALKQIFRGKQKRYQRRRAANEAAKPKTTAVDQRLDTIRAAAKQSRFAPTGDHDELLRKIKERKQSGADKEVLSNITIQSKASVPGPSWTHTVDQEQAATTPSPTPATQPEAVAPHHPPTTPQSPAPVADIPATPVTHQQPAPQAPASLPTQPAATAPTHTARATTEEADVETVAKTAPSPGSATAPRRTPFIQSAALYYAAIGFLFLAGGGLLGSSVWWWLQRDTTETVATAETPAVTQSLITATTDTVPLSDRDTLFNSFYNDQLVTSDIVAYAFTTPNGTEATPQEVLTALELRLSGTGYRSITAITAGNWQGTDPYLVLAGTTFDSLFASLLQWERTMSSDLAPLFGEPVTNSFDPAARTDNQIRTAFFADDVVANTSVRLLRDELGETKLLYGFVNPTTVIITTSEDAYRALLPLIVR